MDVYNDETLILDPVSHGKDFPKAKLTCCGMRHLSGRVALAYARCRHIEQGCTDGDIGRARRQQKVIFAIRDKVVDPESFPTLMAQAPELYSTFSEGIHTNLTLEDAIKLAVLVRDIPKEDIRNEVINNKMVVFDSVILGGLKASIMRPIPDQIRLLRDQIFTASGPLRPLAQGYPTDLMQADHARIRILNGTSTPELDIRTGNYFSQLGMLVTEHGDTKASSRTTILLDVRAHVHTADSLEIAVSAAASVHDACRRHASMTRLVTTAGIDSGFSSGNAHDAAEMARLIPTVMIFSSSSPPVSHTKEEDTPEADLRVVSEEFAAEAKAVRLNNSSCQVYIALRPGEGFDDVGDLLFHSEHRGFDIEAMLSRDISSRTFSFYYPRTRPGSDRWLVVSSTNANYRDWAELSDEDYQASKRDLCETTLDCLEQYVPGIRDKVDWVEASTPVFMLMTPAAACVTSPSLRIPSAAPGTLCLLMSSSRRACTSVTRRTSSPSR